MKTKGTAVIAVFLSFAALSAGAADYRIELRQRTWELKPGLSTTVWSYGETVPGTPITVNVGDKVRILVRNNLAEATNVHWHGLVVPNDQDGPFIKINSGETHTYEFIVTQAGTYWYHPHFRPVLPQLDRGLYGAFIVKAPEDARYSADHTYVLDDWYLDARGRRIEAIPSTDMERIGNVDTVNGKTESAIEPLVLKSGELHKVRFINASTAVTHTLKISGHLFRVTHTDGHPLGEAYETDTLTLAPAQRIDAEVFARGKVGTDYAISDPERDFGLVIPVRYIEGMVPAVASPFVPPPSRAFAGVESMKPAYVLEFASVMGMSGGGMMSGGAMDDQMGMMGGMQGMHGSSSMGGAFRWTINGKSFPETIPLDVQVGKVVKLRLYNKDNTAMMGHRMDHPIHLHGVFFQIVSENGQPPARETWRDTVSVPEGKYVDVAFVMTYPGDWMLHCHIIDHEDGGMMTMVRAH
jgi:FtsP/CotA-like multicopper oxidase with cupredoxin domain